MNVYQRPHEVTQQQREAIIAHEQLQDYRADTNIAHTNRLLEGEFYEITIRLPLMHRYYQDLGLNIQALSGGFQAS